MKTTYAVMTLICAMGMSLMGCVADAANESADELAQETALAAAETQNAITAALLEAIVRFRDAIAGTIEGGTR